MRVEEESGEKSATTVPMERVDSTAGSENPRLRLQMPPRLFGSMRGAVADSTLGGLARQISAPSVKFTIPGEESTSRLSKLKGLIPKPDISWILNNLDATHLKPAIRTAVATWISVLLILIPETQAILGQASFLIIVAGMLSPPSEPFIAVLERELAILFFASISFAWSSLGIFLASLARSTTDLSANEIDIFMGKYIEAPSTIICAIFLFIGTSALLYIRARAGPGPYAIAIILSCIVSDVSLTVGHLFPYAYYNVGKTIVIPIAFHSAIALVCSVTVFPETVNAQFTKRFRNVFIPLAKAMKTQPDIFATSAISDAFDPEPFLKQVAAAEGALAPLAATSRLLKRDLSWSRFGSKDFSLLHEQARKMTMRANGMGFYFKIIDPMVNKQPGTPALSRITTPVSSPPPSRPSSPPVSRPPSRPPSPSHSQTDLSQQTSPTPSTRRRSRHRHHTGGNSLYHTTLHLYHALQKHASGHHHHSSNAPSIFHEAMDRENTVGVFESVRYLNLESRLAHPHAEEWIPKIIFLLSESSRELTECCAETLEHVANWLERMNQDRFWKLFRREREKSWQETIEEDEAVYAKLRAVLDDFRQNKRHRVLDLYRAHIDPTFSPPGEDPPPHRYLFQCYTYQYHLMFFAEHLCTFLKETIHLEKTRPRSRLWLPILPLKQIIFWSKWEPTDSGLQTNEDEDPDIIQGIDPEKQHLLDVPQRRDPDALPPGNILEAIGSLFHHSAAGLTRGNAVFGFKAGVVSVLLSLPNFVPSSAFFAYRNRSIWALVIGQLTMSRFRGDTIFGWFSRVLATFLGGILGAVMWYISTGTGDGNAYGLAAVCFVCFPFLFFARLNYPASPMTLTIFCVTTGLVFGYSWQDTHLPSLSYAGIGIEVAWKRFLLVTIGVTAAFIISFLPPSTTLRRYLRTTYATTAQQLGGAYCDVVSLSTVPEGPEGIAIIKELMAIRMKLRRSTALMANVPYEFSLRGKWPKERYKVVCEIQMEIAYLLSHLRSVTEHLELSWARAFLRRTRFLDPEFQGDVLAVISMISTSLRTGSPLPQVTPCPLLDRFVASAHRHGLYVLRPPDSGTGTLYEDEDSFGLPRKLTTETLEDEQYMYFSVGVANAYQIVTRLDRLMIATKELVGEQFHIQGLPVYMPKRGTA
ncbi:hypothetical protein PNOK_0154000 [Pyrrhoderma noxium]|uniref:ER transporter 6TM N-terminal domain-containing protein n=1 Tax=Pyrrhoderma noxium TaxID=2282107 RepID=A0A286UPQ8_9AGAM|nr:hypothetical protein PNOK_0154000 [Pyrrhoderma noxium]